MTKYEWDRQLKKGISGLPQNEQQRVIDYYNELFADKIDAHMREQDIIAEFGNPYDVANKILVDFYSDGRDNQAADSYVYSSPDGIDQDFDEQKPTENVYHSERVGERVQKNQQAETEPAAKVKTKTAHNKQNPNATKSVGGLISLIGVLTFFVLGACFDLWHPAWMVFLLVPVVTSLVQAVETHDWRKFAYPVFVAFVFLAIGFAWGSWHPCWIVFLTIPLYYVAGNYITKNVNKQPIQESDDIPTTEGAEKDSRPQPNEQADSATTPIAEDKKTSTSANGNNLSAGRIVAGVFMAIALVYVAIVVWSVVISMFIAGIGMIAGGIATIVVSIIRMTVSMQTAMIVLGVGLIVIGLGFVLTFGFAGLFKQCMAMCRSFAKIIRRCFGKKEVA